jgi:DNA-binding MarR family transcriptional regulator
MESQSEQRKDRFEMIRAQMNLHFKRVAGIDDTSGIELISLMRMLMNLLESIETQKNGENELSGPRWAVLMRLYAEENRGSPRGLTPTSLSRLQNVSKNTTSSLLRGLEEQGYIQRTLDTDDRRLFHIELTPSGRELVCTKAPLRLQHLNRLVTGLDEGERAELIALLEKWYRSLLPNSSFAELVHPQADDKK